MRRPPKASRIAAWHGDSGGAAASCWGPGGGALLATGVWFAYVAHRTIENCDAVNRGGGICQMGDTTFTTLAPLAFLVAGLVLSVYGLVTDPP